MGPSEDQLKTWMVEGLNGNAASHAALLRSLAPKLRAFYGRRVAESGAIEDLVQDTLIAIHTRRMSYDRERPFSAWLFAIARYKMIDHFRRGRHSHAYEDLDGLLASECFEEEVTARIDVDRMLAELPPKQAAMIRKTRIDGESVADAAVTAGISESDVKISVHRGLKALVARIRGSHHGH